MGREGTGVVREETKASMREEGKAPRCPPRNRFWDWLLDRKSPLIEC
jgi:hypothetical protein